MAKPILILGVPRDQPTEQMIKLTNNLRSNLPDYHVLVFFRRDLEMKMEVLNNKECGTKSVEDILDYVDSEMLKFNE